jgi:hypothetical protein
VAAADADIAPNASAPLHAIRFCVPLALPALYAALFARRFARRHREAARTFARTRQHRAVSRRFAACRLLERMRAEMTFIKILMAVYAMLMVALLPVLILRTIAALVRARHARRIRAARHASRQRRVALTNLLQADRLAAEAAAVRQSQAAEKQIRDARK